VISWWSFRADFQPVGVEGRIFRADGPCLAYLFSDSWPPPLGGRSRSRCALRDSLLAQGPASSETWIGGPGGARLYRPLLEIALVFHPSGLLSFALWPSWWPPSTILPALGGSFCREFPPRVSPGEFRWCTPPSTPAVFAGEMTNARPSHLSQHPDVASPPVRVGAGCGLAGPPVIADGAG